MEPITSLDDFTIWSPSSVYFEKYIRVKNINDWKYTRHDNYWVAESPFYEDGFEKFKSFVSQSPVWRTNSEQDFNENNPFATIHLPTWATENLCTLLRDFYAKEVGVNFSRYRYEEWGNIFDRKYCKPLPKWRIPHIDNARGIVGNLWFSSGDNTGTKLYRYKKETRDTQLEFHYNDSMEQHHRWNSMSDLGRVDEWYNFEECDYWDFEEIDFAPSKDGTMTIYKSNTPHDPFITPQTNFRWSHTFCCFVN